MEFAAWQPRCSESCTAYRSQNLLCVRVYGDGAQSFLFIYRMNDRQRFLRIGKSPKWSLEAARKRAKELRAVIDQGGDPEIYNRERHKIGPVENLIRYISRELGTNP